MSVLTLSALYYIPLDKSFSRVKIHVNKNLQNILKSHKINPAINRSTDLMQISQKYNQFCVTVSQFNKFWPSELLMDAILFSSTILVLVYISFLTAIDTLLKIYFGSFAIIIILCFSSIFSQWLLLQRRYKF